MAAVTGIGTAVVTWPVLFVAMLAGLAASMPPHYGGLGLGFAGGLVISWGLGATLMTGLVWLASWLLQRAGVRRPLTVVLGGLALAVGFTAGCVLLLHAGAVDPPDWCGLLLLPAVGLCFGLVAGGMQRRGRDRLITTGRGPPLPGGWHYGVHGKQ